MGSKYHRLRRETQLNYAFSISRDGIKEVSCVLFSICSSTNLYGCTKFNPEDNLISFSWNDFVYTQIF